MEDAPPSFGCGHPRTPENTAKNGKNCPGGACKICKRERTRADYTANLDESRRRGRERTMRHRRAKGVQEGPRNARKTHCPQGHPYDDENTYVAPSGNRQCKTCRRAAVRSDYEKHKPRRQEDQRAWGAKNAEWKADYNRAWVAANRERANLTSRLKKQRRRAAGTLTPADWQAVLDLYGSSCLACGSDAPPTIDHVTPISRGGLNVAENVQPLCMDCNNRKGTKTVDYRPGAAVV